MPAREDLYEAEQAINNVLKIKRFVTAIPAVFDALTNASCALLQKVKNTCHPELTDQVMALISQVINDDATFADSPLELRHQRTWAVKVCFAVRFDAFMLIGGRRIRIAFLMSVASYTKKQPMSCINISKS